MAPIPGEDAEVMIEMTAKNLEYDISLIDKAVAGFERILKVWLRVTGFSDGSVVKNPPANVGDTNLIPYLARSHMMRSN